MSSVMNCRVPRPDAHNRLFCFPWPGVHSDIFAQWADNFTDGGTEVVCFRLPGHESRKNEDYPPTLEEIAKEFASAIMGLDQKQFALFGHGLGAWFALETARQLMLADTYYLPDHLIISAELPPYIPDRDHVDIAAMTEDQFVTWHQEQIETKKHGGGAAVEAAEAFQDIGSSDRKLYEVLHAYSYQIPATGPEFNWPLTVISGESDAYFDSSKYAEEWGKVTDGPFEIETLPGGHFYMLDKNNTETLFSSLNMKLDLLGEL